MSSLPRGEIITDAAQGSFPQVPLLQAPFAVQPIGKHRILAGLQQFIAFTLPSGSDFLNDFWYWFSRFMVAKTTCGRAAQDAVGIHV
jgi:hypothetical protein